MLHPLVKRLLRNIFGFHLGQLQIYAPRTLPELQQNHNVLAPGMDHESMEADSELLDDPPRIAVVTPVRNQVNFIEATLVSVVSQRFRGLEYVVIDGASDDGTVEIVKGFKAHLSYRSSPDSGQADAVNKGFSHTSAPIMAWLNGDDILLPGALAYVFEFFAMHPEVDVLYGHRILIDSEGRDIGRWILPPHWSPILSWLDYVPQETMFWRRSAWERAGGRVDTTFDFAMDWAFLVRLRDTGASFIRVPKYLAAFRIHEGQKTSKSIVAGHKEMNRIRLACLGRVPGRFEMILATLGYAIFNSIWKLGCFFHVCSE